MPTISGKNAGSQNVAKASENVVDLAIVDFGTSFTSRQLKTPGLPKISCNVLQSAGANSLECTIQGAARLDQTGGLDWFSLVPPFLVSTSGHPTVVEVNLAVQAVRLVAANNGAAGNVTVEITLSATG